MPDKSIAAFIKAIEQLPPGKPVSEPGVWYRTQKEHWLGWLNEYQGPSFYGRLPRTKRSARLAYSRIVNPQMLVWLIDAAGLEAHLPESARAPVRGSSEMMQRSALLRRNVPWEAVAQALRLPTDGYAGRNAESLGDWVRPYSGSDVMLRLKAAQRINWPGEART